MRANNYAGSDVIKDETAQYIFPAALETNEWALQGAWTVSADKVTAAQRGAALKIHFTAGKVYLVMGNKTNRSIKVTLRLNGESVINEKGNDVVNSVIDVNKHTLYNAIILPHPASGILELTVSEPGLEVYTFTFGN